MPTPAAPANKMAGVASTRPVLKAPVARAVMPAPMAVPAITELMAPALRLTPSMRRDGSYLSDEAGFG